jgi:hypothetical protein
MEGAVVALPQAAPSSRKAVTSLVLAVLSVLFGWVGLFLLLTPLAIVFGSLALRDIRHGRAIKGRRMAWVAIVASILAPVVWILLFYVALIAGSGGGGYFG